MTQHRIQTTNSWWNAYSTLSRVVAAILGGYAFAWGFTALGSMLLISSGMVRSEAVITATMLGFLVYLVAAVWAFAATRHSIIWFVLAGGGTAMTVSANWLAKGI